MKKMIFAITFLLSLSTVKAQDLMVVNNTSAPMNGSIRLHGKYNDPNPELGDIDIAIPPAGNIWIFDPSAAPNSIPFLALDNPAMPFYTPILGANFLPNAMGTNYSQPVSLFDGNEYKWSCIKTDISSYFNLASYPIGYIQIAPPYNPSMGSAVPTSWGYMALSAAPYEVFAVNNFEYNSSFVINGTTPQQSLNFINGTSPFGGYMIMVTVY